MKKENKGAAAQTEVNVTATENGVVVDTSKMSKAQLKLLERKIREKKGEVIKKGRKADPESKAQIEKAKKEALRKEGLLKKGRPAYTPEQKAEAEKARVEREKQMEIEADIAAQKLIEEGKADEVLAAVSAK